MISVIKYLLFHLLAVHATATGGINV